MFEEFLPDFFDQVEPVAHSEIFDQVDQHCQNYQYEESPTNKVSLIILSHEVGEA